MNTTPMRLSALLLAALLGGPTASAIAAGAGPVTPTVAWGTPQALPVGTLTQADLQASHAGDTFTLLLPTFGVNLSGDALSGVAVAAVQIPVTPVAGKKLAGYVVNLRGAAQTHRGGEVILTLDYDGHRKVVSYGAGKKSPRSFMLSVAVKRASGPITLFLIAEARRPAAGTALLQIDTVDVRAIVTPRRPESDLHHVRARSRRTSAAGSSATRTGPTTRSTSPDWSTESSRSVSRRSNSWRDCRRFPRNWGVRLRAEEETGTWKTSRPNGW